MSSGKLEHVHVYQLQVRGCGEAQMLIKKVGLEVVVTRWSLSGTKMFSELLLFSMEALGERPRCF